MSNFRSGVIALMLAMLAGCASQQRCGEIQHVVIVWLKEPGNADHRRQMIERSHELAKIPGVRRVEPGVALSAERIGVDSSFDVGVVITFKDEAALRAYDQHPIHQQAVREVLAPLSAKFVVYDFKRNAD